MLSNAQTTNRSSCAPDVDSTAGRRGDQSREIIKPSAHQRRARQQRKRPKTRFSGPPYRPAAPMMQISARREPAGPARKAGPRSNGAPLGSTLWRKIPEGGISPYQACAPLMTTMARTLPLQPDFSRSQIVNKQTIKTWRRRADALKKRNQIQSQAGNILR